MDDENNYFNVTSIDGILFNNENYEFWNKRLSTKVSTVIDAYIIGFKYIKSDSLYIEESPILQFKPIDYKQNTLMGIESLIFADSFLPYTLNKISPKSITRLQIKMNTYIRNRNLLPLRIPYIYDTKDITNNMLEKMYKKYSKSKDIELASVMSMYKLNDSINKI